MVSAGGGGARDEAGAVGWGCPRGPEPIQEGGFRPGAGGKLRASWVH